MPDMSGEAVTGRLRRLAELSAAGIHTGPVPMDAASVTARLRSLSDLRDLCLRLGRARSRESPVDEPVADESD